MIKATTRHTMSRRKVFRAILSALAILLALQTLSAQAPQSTGATTLPDGQHDFDWDIGVWKTHQKRLLHPLTGSTTWVEYEGTDVVRRIWDGANEGLIQAKG